MALWACLRAKAVLKAVYEVSGNLGEDAALFVEHHHGWKGVDAIHSAAPILYLLKFNRRLKSVVVHHVEHADLLDERQHEVDAILRPLHLLRDLTKIVVEVVHQLGHRCNRRPPYGHLVQPVFVW